MPMVSTCALAMLVQLVLSEEPSIAEECLVNDGAAMIQIDNVALGAASGNTIPLDGAFSSAAVAAATSNQATSVVIEAADPGLFCQGGPGSENFNEQDFWSFASTVANSYPPALKQQIRLLSLSLVGALAPGGGACADWDSCKCETWQPINPLYRTCGMDWPAMGFTMVGLARLKNVADILWQVISRKIPGDFAELGVWRGGTCIFAKSILNAMGENDRTVHVFDAFERIPGYGKSVDFLAISEATARANFELFQALDSKVIFHKGLFKDTLPQFHANNPAAKLAVLRVDANFYTSYQDTLYYLYGFVQVGGYVIFDDAYSHYRALQAWKDFKRDHGLTEELTRIDRNSAYFQKTRDVKIDFTKMHRVSLANDGPF